MSEPTAVPEDIREAARLALRDYGADPVALEAAVIGALLAERQRCGRLAARFIIDGNSIHPDVPFERLDEKAKFIAHATCQYVASAISGEMMEDEAIRSGE